MKKMKAIMCLCLVLLLSFSCKTNKKHKDLETVKTELKTQGISTTNLETLSNQEKAVKTHKQGATITPINGANAVIVEKGDKGWKFTNAKIELEIENNELFERTQTNTNQETIEQHELNETTDTKSKSISVERESDIFKNIKHILYLLITIAIILTLYRSRYRILNLIKRR